MERYFIEKTKGTPEVRFDPDSRILSIKGQSYPENAFKFYEPIFAWLDSFLKDSEDGLGVELAFPYINTSSSKCIMMLLDKLEEAYQSGRKIRVTWYYDRENESELECAEEFKEDITLPFTITAIEE